MRVRAVEANGTSSDKVRHIYLCVTISNEVDSGGDLHCSDRKLKVSIGDAMAL